MAVWISGLVVIGGALIANNASKNAARAGVDAAEQGAQENRNALAQQERLAQQQIEIQRPLIQSRDAALNQLNAFFGLPQSEPTSFGGGGGATLGGAGSGMGTGAGPNAGTGGAQLIALPGVRAQLSRGSKGSQGAIDFLGAFNDPGSPGKSIDRLFYDTGSGAIVDEMGNLVANVPEGGGIIPALVHGKDNQVAVGADGSITSVGTRGQNVLAIPRLQRVQPAQQVPGAPAGTAQAQAGGVASGGTRAPAAPFDTSNILNLPIFAFQRQQGESVINRNLAARGKFYSGERGAGLLRFNNALVANRINEDFIQPRLTLAGYGQGAGNSAQNALAGQSSNVGQAGVNAALLASDRGNARASGYAGTANAVTGALGNLLTLREMNTGARPTAQQPRNTEYSYYGARTPFGVY